MLNSDHRPEERCRQLSWMATEDRPIRSACCALFLSLFLLSSCGRAPEHAGKESNSPEGLGKALSLVEKDLSEQARSRTYWDLVLRKAQILEQLNRRDEALSWLRWKAPTTDSPPDLAVLLIRERAAIEGALGQFREADRDLEEAIARAGFSGQADMVAALEVRRAKIL